MNSKTQPLAKFGKEIRVTCWRGKNGGISFSIEKQYKDKETNEWKKTNTWWDNDIEKLIPLLKEALEYNKQDREQRKAWDKPQDDMPF